MKELLFNPNLFFSEKSKKEGQFQISCTDSTYYFHTSNRFRYSNDE